MTNKGCRGEQGHRTQTCEWFGAELWRWSLQATRRVRRPGKVVRRNHGQGLWGEKEKNKKEGEKSEIRTKDPRRPEPPDLALHAPAGAAIHRQRHRRRRAQANKSPLLPPVLLPPRPMLVVESQQSNQNPTGNDQRRMQATRSFRRHQCTTVLTVRRGVLVTKTAWALQHVGRQKSSICGHVFVVRGMHTTHIPYTTHPAAKLAQAAKIKLAQASEAN